MDLKVPIGLIFANDKEAANRYLKIQRRWQRERQKSNNFKNNPNLLAVPLSLANIGPARLTNHDVWLATSSYNQRVLLEYRVISKR